MNKKINQYSKKSLVIYMVEITDDKLTKVLAKATMIAKMMKTVQDDVDEIKQKMVKAPEEEKGTIQKVFEAKGIGRPAGNFDSKQQQYLKMLNDGKIKQPKEKTLEFYKIAMDKDGKYYLWPD